MRKVPITWELVVKYSGNISPLEDVERGIVIEQLSNEYAIGPHTGESDCGVCGKPGN